MRKPVASGSKTLIVLACVGGGVVAVMLVCAFVALVVIVGVRSRQSHDSYGRDHPGSQADFDEAYAMARVFINRSLHRRDDYPMESGFSKKGCTCLLIKDGTYRCRGEEGGKVWQIGIRRTVTDRDSWEVVDGPFFGE